MEKNVKHSLEDEQLLLQQVAIGNREAFTTIYTFYVPKLYQYIQPFVRFSKEDTEEILHDLFMKIWERKEEFAKITSLKTYLYAMARNKLVNVHAHRKVKQKAIDYISTHRVTSGDAADEHFIYAEYNLLMEHAIGLLPPGRRQVFEMSTYQELSYDEIAIELQISKSVVKKQFYSASKQIKEYLRVHADLTTVILCCSATYWIN